MTKADTAFTQAVEHADKSDLENLLDTDFTWTNAGGKGSDEGQRKFYAGLPHLLFRVAKDSESKAYTYGDLTAMSR